MLGKHAGDVNASLKWKTDLVKVKMVSTYVKPSSRPAAVFTRVRLSEAAYSTTDILRWQHQRNEQRPDYELTHRWISTTACIGASTLTDGVTQEK